MRKNDNISNFIKKIDDDISYYKTTQKTNGKSFVNYSVSSTDNYDFAIILDTATKAFRLTFDHNNEKYNIVDLSWFVRIDNSDVMSNPRLSNATPYTVEVCFEKPQLGKTTWVIDCSNIDYPNTHTFYFKFYFNGTVDGVFSAAVI